MKTKFNEDYHFIQRCCTGDATAWHKFYTIYAPQVELVINLYLTDHRVPELLPQVKHFCNDIFLKLMDNEYQKLKLYIGKAKLATWLSTVTTNYTIEQLRKFAKERHRKVSFDILPDEEDQFTAIRHPAIAEKIFTDPIDRVMMGARDTKIRQIIGTLSPYEQTLYTLKFENQYTQEQIGVILNRKPGTVGRDLSNMYAKLRLLFAAAEITI